MVRSVSRSKAVSAGKKVPHGRTIKKRSRWSGEVTRHSDALDLEPSVFKSSSATHIACSLKHSAEHSKRRKGTAFQSAMSMLNFYINRGGTGIGRQQKAVLEKAKDELRKAFHRQP